MTISKSESVQNVRTFISYTKKQISSIESIINSVKLNVIQRYSINITLNGVGISKVFTSENVYQVEDDFVHYLRSVGVIEVAPENSYAEISNATLSYYIDDMKSDYFEITGDKIRYKVPVQVNPTKVKESEWRYFDEKLIIRVHKLPQTEKDIEDANEKMNSEIYVALEKAGFLSPDGTLI